MVNSTVFNVIDDSTAKETQLQKDKLLIRGNALILGADTTLDQDVGTTADVAFNTLTVATSITTPLLILNPSREAVFNVPLSSAKAAGAGVPTWATAIGPIYLWQFTPNADEYLYFQAQMPIDIDVTKPVVPYMHWYPSTTHVGGVVWTLDYALACIGDAFPVVETTDTITVTSPGVALKHVLSPFTPIDISGCCCGTMVVCRFGRLGTDGADLFTGDAVGLEFDFHYYTHA